MYPHRTTKHAQKTKRRQAKKEREEKQKKRKKTKHKLTNTTNADSDDKQQASPLGRVGVAVTADRSSTVAQLMVYRGQQDYLCTVDITASFAYTAQNNNYATFYAKDGHAWSLQYGNAADARNALIHVALAKFFVSGQKNVMVVDEQAQLTGTHSLSAGDTAGIKYTAWLTKPDTGALSTVIDSNAAKDGFSRIIIGDTSTSFQAWHAALTGKKKGYRAIVVSPPALAYGAAGVPGTVPPNTIVVYELEVARVKRAAPAPAPAAAAAEAPTISAPSTLFEGYPAGDTMASAAEAQKTELMQRLARAGAKPMPGSPLASTAALPHQPAAAAAAATAAAAPQAQAPQQTQTQQVCGKKKQHP